ncbi:unnamed protein product [Ixodes pacificus]
MKFKQVKIKEKGPYSVLVNPGMLRTAKFYMPKRFAYLVIRSCAWMRWKARQATWSVFITCNMDVCTWVILVFFPFSWRKQFAATRFIPRTFQLTG